MKKIVIWTDTKTSPAVIHQFEHCLQKLNTLFTVQSTAPDAQQFQGCIYLKTDFNKSESSNILQFFEQSKPIVTLQAGAQPIAEILREHSQLISIASNTHKEIKNIEMIECPEDDFITDRYTKLLSTTIREDKSEITESAKKGLWLICKELVEMA